MMAKATIGSDREVGLPKEPVDTFVEPLTRFLHVESASGVVLLVATASALILANSPMADSFLTFWKTPFGFEFGALRMRHSLQHWINDGLMAIFFFVIGLEVKRELVLGELKDLRQAVMPIAAAVGGMVVPAGAYLLLQYGHPGQRGWGIPMATDIAFVVGCLAVLGPRIPGALRVMLLSLAIADDIGAILVIAIGYTESINLSAFGWGIFGIGVVLVMMKVGVRSVPIYCFFMFLVWLAFHESGIHATIAGVIFGFLTPTKAWISRERLSGIVCNTKSFFHGEGWRCSEERYAMLRKIERATRKAISPLERFENELHPWVAFVIMPVFALANAGVPVHSSDFGNPLSLAVIVGLVVGKPFGVFACSWLTVKFGLARLPHGVGWGAVLGGGFLAGIGFTMAIFVAGLALEGPMLDAAKVGILLGSVLSGIAGMALLIVLLKKPSLEGA